MVSPATVKDITASLFEVYTSTGFRHHWLMDDAIQGPPGMPYDGIGTGVSGLCLFALELFKHTGDRAILGNLLRSVDRLEQHRLSVKTNNYSLLGGRTGLAWLYWQLFHATGDEQYIDRSVAITRHYLSKEGGHLKLFSNNGLANGTAGMVLFYLHLYDTIRETWLLDALEQGVLLLAGKSQLAPAGIYWNNANSNNRHAGWLNGSAGIAFTLLEMGRYFNNPALLALAESTLACEDDLLVKEAAWDFADRSGCTGHCKPEGCNTACRSVAGQAAWGSDLIRLYACRQHGFVQYSNAFSGHEQRLVNASLSGMGDGILNGKAGWGLAFREAWLLTGDARYAEKANDIAAQLVTRLPAGGGRANQPYNFYHGFAGIGYFLLKLVESPPISSLLLPRCAGQPQGSGPSLHLAVDHQAINERILKNNFGDAAFLLKRELPEAFRELVARPVLLAAPAFANWAQQLPTDGLPDEQAQRLQEAVEREMLVIGIRAQSHGRAADDDLQYVQKVNEFLQLADEEILRLRLSVSGSMTILRQDPAIDYSRALEPAMLPVIFQSYGSHSYYFRINKYNNIEQGRLGLARLFADLFEQPAIVDAAIGTFLDFVLDQDEAVVNLVIAHLQAGDRDTCRRQLAEMALHYIKELYMIGVLCEAGSTE